MKKTDFCDRLEKLSEAVCEAVEAALSGKRISDKVCECETLVSGIEKELFSDFMPQYGREGIAEISHNLLRIAYAAERIGAQKSTDVKSCNLLIKRLDENVKLLKSIRMPNIMPTVDEFRRLYREGSNRSCGGATFSGTERLRQEISSCFDKLVEVMLANI